MPLTRRFFVLALAALAALSIAPNRNAAARGRPLVLEEFFLGTTTGRGVFESRIAGVNRGFDVTATGTMDGETLTVVEDFFFDDGEEDRKTWRFTKVAPSRYEGTREDVVGTAEIVAQGGKLYMRYLIDLAGKDGASQRLHFSDILERTEDGRVLNTARVTKFGIPVAKVEVIFDK